MREWIIAISAASVGLLGTWVVVYLANLKANARRDGIVDEKLKVVNARVGKVEHKVDNQAEQIARIEGRLEGALPGHRAW